MRCIRATIRRASSGSSAGAGPPGGCGVRPIHEARTEEDPHGASPRPTIRARPGERRRALTRLRRADRRPCAVGVGPRHVTSTTRAASPSDRAAGSWSRSPAVAVRRPRLRPDRSDRRPRRRPRADLQGQPPVDHLRRGEASGPVGVSVDRWGRVYGTIGGGPQNLNKRFGTVMRFAAPPGAHPGRHRRLPADRPRSDRPRPAAEPDRLEPVRDRRPSAAVVSWSPMPAGNDLLLVRGRPRRHRRALPEPGDQHRLPAAVFGVPPGLQLPAEAVPTSVAVGPDGYWYVGELKGFPFTPGTSRIWRVAPWARNVTCDPTATSGPCTLFMDGFTSIVGLAWGKHGACTSSRWSRRAWPATSPGPTRSAPCGRSSTGSKTELVPGRLTLPGGVAVGRNGTIYVTNKSVSVGRGRSSGSVPDPSSGHRCPVAARSIDRAATAVRAPTMSP